MLIISDIHGCYQTLIALLERCPDDDIAFAGDLIDRGPNSPAVLQYAIDNNIPTVMGNHEHMMIDHYDNTGIYPDGIWKNNGGGFDITKEQLNWVRELPKTLQFGDLTIQHTAWDEKIPCSTIYPEFWYRGSPRPDRSGFIVYGHTPNKVPVIGHNHAMIDTGAAYYRFGYGVLTAFQYPEKKIFQQTYIGE